MTFDMELMSQEKTEILIAFEPWIPYSLDSPLYSKGVNTQILPNTVTRKYPKAKHIGWIRERKSILGVLPEGIYEMLLVHEIENVTVVSEALGCNFIGLVDNNTLIIPQNNLLIGIARAILISAVKQEFEIVYKSPSVEEVLSMKECYLCSASRGIFPIVKIDDTPISNGNPGPIFAKLFTLYHQQLQSELCAI